MTVTIKNIEAYAEAVLANGKPDLIKRTRALRQASAALPAEVRACLRELRESGVSFKHSTWRQCPMSTVALTKAPGECNISMTKNAIKSGKHMLDDALTVLSRNPDIRARFETRSASDRRAFENVSVSEWLDEKYDIGPERDGENQVAALLKLGGVKITQTQVHAFAIAWDGVATAFAKREGQTTPNPPAVVILDTVLKVNRRKAGAVARKN